MFWLKCSPKLASIVNDIPDHYILAMLCSSMREVILHSHSCSIILKHSRTLLFGILVTYHACRSTITLKCSLVPMSSQVLLTLVVFFFFEANSTPSGKKTAHDFQTCCCTSIHLQKPWRTIQWSQSVQCLHTSHVTVHTEQLWPLISSLILPLFMLFFFPCFFFLSMRNVLFSFLCVNINILLISTYTSHNCVHY